MALAALSGDEQRVIFVQLCDPLDPDVAVAFSSTSSELRELTRAERQQLQADHKAAAAWLGCKLRVQSCKELREAKEVAWCVRSLSLDDFALLGTLVLPALERLFLFCELASLGDGVQRLDLVGSATKRVPAAGPEGVQRLAEKLGAGALPAVTALVLDFMHVGDTGASALAAALGRGALPRLKSLVLRGTRIDDAGLVALAPALRRLPALEHLDLCYNSFGDEGLAALAAPPAAAGALRPPAGDVLTRLKKLEVGGNMGAGITDAGCATLAEAIDSGILPVLEEVLLKHIRASDASRAAVQDALTWRLTDFGAAEKWCMLKI